MSRRLLARFARAEDGAVTVDWVVLTAAVIGLGLAVLAAITDSSTNLAGRISAAILNLPL